MNRAPSVRGDARTRRSCRCDCCSDADAGRALVQSPFSLGVDNYIPVLHHNNGEIPGYAKCSWFKSPLTPCFSWFKSLFFMAKSQPPWCRFPLVFPSRLRPSLAEQIRRATWVAESEDPPGCQLGDGKIGKPMDCNNQHLGFIMIYQELDRLGPTITGLVVSIMFFVDFR